MTTDLDMILAELDAMRIDLIAEGWTEEQLSGIDFLEDVAR